MRSKGALIGLIIICATMLFSAVAFKNSLINYVPYSEATHATDSTVQIIGAPVDGTMAYDTSVHELKFAMADGHGQVMPVVFKGPKPEDLDTAMKKATQITAQGSFSASQRVFVADNLLVKCPSKYQGQGANGTERSYGAS